MSGRTAVGGDSRYDTDRPVRAEEAAESQALHIVADLLSQRPGFVLDTASSRQICAVLRTEAIELAAGRAVAPRLRSAVRGLANALREQMDPRSPHNVSSSSS